MQNSKYVLFETNKLAFFCTNSAKVDAKADLNNPCSLATAIVVVLHYHSPVVINQTLYRKATEAQRPCLLQLWYI